MGAGVHSPLIRDETKAKLKLSQLFQYFNELVVDIPQQEMPRGTLSPQEEAISLENNKTRGTDFPKYAMDVRVSIHKLVTKAEGALPLKAA